MNTFKITTADLEKLKSLITDFGSYYYYDDEDNPWTFEDVDAQREIALEIIDIIKPIIDK
jgi:hypothetical protein